MQVREFRARSKDKVRWRRKASALLRRKARELHFETLTCFRNTFTSPICVGTNAWKLLSASVVGFSSFSSFSLMPYLEEQIIKTYHVRLRCILHAFMCTCVNASHKKQLQVQVRKLLSDIT